MGEKKQRKEKKLESSNELKVNLIIENSSEARGDSCSKIGKKKDKKRKRRYGERVLVESIDLDCGLDQSDKKGKKFKSSKIDTDLISSKVADEGLGNIVIEESKNKRKRTSKEDIEIDSSLDCRENSDTKKETVKKAKKKSKESRLDRKLSLVKQDRHGEKKVAKEEKRKKRKMKDIEDAEAELDVQICELQSRIEDKKLQKVAKHVREASESSLDITEEGEIDGKEESKKKKKKEKKKKEEEYVAKKDAPEGRGSSVHPSLMYLQMWKSDQKNWTFKKVRQVWLLQHMYNKSKVSLW